MNAALVIKAPKSKARVVGRIFKREYGAVRVDRFSHGPRIYKFPGGLSGPVDAANRVIATPKVSLALLMNCNRDLTPRVCKQHIAEQAVISRTFGAITIPQSLASFCGDDVELIESSVGDAPRTVTLKAISESRRLATPDLRRLPANLFRDQAKPLRTSFRKAVEALAKGVTSFGLRSKDSWQPIRRAVRSFLSKSLSPAELRNVSAIGFGLWPLNHQDGGSDRIALIIHTTLANRQMSKDTHGIELPGVGRFDVVVSNSVWEVDAVNGKSETSRHTSSLQGAGQGQPRHPEVSVFDDSKTYFGTVAGFTEIDGENYAFTCGHVLWRQSNIRWRAVLGNLLGGFSPVTFIDKNLCPAPLRTHVKFSRLPHHNRKSPADIAFFGPLPNSAVKDFRRVVRPTNGNVDPGARVKYFGAMTGNGTARVVEELRGIKIYSPDYGVRACKFPLLLAFNGGTQKGDSGALIIEVESDAPVAMHTGRLTRGGESLAFGQMIEYAFSQLP